MALRKPAQLSVLLLAVLSLPACAAPPRELTPAQLAGRPRTRLEQGDAARQAIGHLHGKDVAPVESAVASYGADGRLVLFASRFADAPAAEQTLRAMLGRMAPGGTPFSPPVADPARPGTWLCVGPGGHHALWAAGDVVFWVQGDPAGVAAGRGELP
ncbi:MAG: hypothetical protein MUF27_01340 [Acidobacteria bacterium]|nr:hypothetical protein [Acidobacteriota bacterium]